VYAKSRPQLDVMARVRQGLPPPAGKQLSYQSAEWRKFSFKLIGRVRVQRAQREGLVLLEAGPAGRPRVASSLLLSTANRLR
jgi:hypothetical protein